MYAREVGKSIVGIVLAYSSLCNNHVRLNWPVGLGNSFVSSIFFNPIIKEIMQCALDFYDVGVELIDGEEL